MWTLINSSKTVNAGVFPTEAAAIQYNEHFARRGVIMAPVELMLNSHQKEMIENLNLWTWTEDSESESLPNFLM